MFKFLRALFAVIGVISTVVVIGVVWLAWGFLARDPMPPPDRIVLHIDLSDGLPDAAPAAGLAASLRQPRPTLADAVAAIDAARRDDRVVALTTDLGSGAMPLTTAQELADAVARFRLSGRPALAFADSFGEIAPAEAAVLLAAAHSEAWMRPEGAVGLAGLAAEVPFASEALTDIGVTAEVARRGAYKTFPESFTETGFTPAHREMLTDLLFDLSAQVTDAVAAGRSLSTDAVRAAIDRGPLTATEALDLDLVDRLDTRAAFGRHVDTVTEEAGRLDLRGYLAVAPTREPAARVAVVHVTGAILNRSDGAPGLLGDRALSAERIADAMAAATRDGVDAALLRIDSPGGSPVASAIIAEAVAEMRSDGVPVVVSMGARAASGGYWVAAGADAIVAHPATLTGSIGVFAGGLATRELWRNLGVTWGRIETAGNTGFWSSIDPYDQGERDRLETLVEATYEAFINHVANGRGMTPAEVLIVAEGRVWTGRQALDRGLIDRLGGLATAEDAIRERLDLADDAPLALVMYPRPRSLLGEIGDLVSGEAAPGLALVQAIEDSPLALDILESLVLQPGERWARTPAALLPN